MNEFARIRDVIPHSPPALLVDWVSEVEPGRRLVARKAVTVAEPGWNASAGWAAPVRAEYAYPVGLLMESWAQSAVLLACWEKPNPDVLSGNAVLLARVRDVRVRAPVPPGSVVEHEVRITHDLGDTVVTSGRSTVDGRPVLDVGQLTLVLRPTSALVPNTPATAGRSS